MGFERVYMAREVALDVDSDNPSASDRFRIEADLPNQDSRLVDEFQFTSEVTTTGRRVMKFRMKGTDKGRLWKFRLWPQSVIKVYGARIYCRAVGVQEPWHWVALPVPPTPEDWEKAALPIPETAEEFFTAPLPIPEVSPLMRWITIPVDGVA